MKKFLLLLVGLFMSTITSLAFADNLDCDALIRGSGVPEGTGQVVVVVPDVARGISYAKLAACEMGKDGKWSAIYDNLSAIVGKNGIAEPGGKIEGDSKTPSGLFYIGETFGYHPLSLSKISNIRMDYRYITNNDFDKFIDDSNTPENNYNTWIIGPTKAASHESMYRQDGLYEYGAVINYNNNPAVPGKGSAIFMHIWGSGKTYTAGCVALQIQDLVSVLNWLDKTKQPQILIKYQ
ncbi:MAG: uncharacterized protein K0R14_814 [Burkholderiales bacterium]|nr:uncharacterized protein [Burkholderiales bacterium]